MNQASILDITTIRSVRLVAIATFLRTPRTMRRLMCRWGAGAEGQLLALAAAGTDVAWGRNRDGKVCYWVDRDSRVLERTLDRIGCELEGFVGRNGAAP